MAIVLLTRPEGQNESFAQLLRTNGFSPVIHPMLRIIPYEVSAKMKKQITDLDTCDDVIVVSANAARIGLERMQAWWPQWPHLRWFAVGDATSSELARFDLIPETPADQRSEGLLALPALGSVAGRKVLIVRGSGGRELLVDTLRRRGATVEYLDVYERRAISFDLNERNALEEYCPAICVIYSSETLSAFAENTRGFASGYHLIVPSGRIGDAAAQMGFRSISVAGGIADKMMLGQVQNVARDL